jgi:hypothetical protein
MRAHDIARVRLGLAVAICIPVAKETEAESDAARY